MKTTIELVSFVLKGKFKNPKRFKDGKGKQKGKKIKEVLVPEINPTNVDSMIEISDKSSADIILFPGWSLESDNQIRSIEDKNKNSRSVAFFSALDKENRERYYTLKNGRVQEVDVTQKFKASDDVSCSRVAELLKEIGEKKEHRIIETSKLKALIFLCGEINCLRYSNIQKKVLFRYENKSDLFDDFLEQVAATNAILHPVHTPMGRPGFVNPKRIFLSKNSRIYLSTANLFVDKGKISKEQPSDREIERRFHTSSKLHYCYFDGEPLSCNDSLITSRYMTRTYEISTSLLASV